MAKDTGTARLVQFRGTAPLLDTRTIFRLQEVAARRPFPLFQNRRHAKPIRQFEKDFAQIFQDQGTKHHRSRSEQNQHGGKEHGCGTELSHAQGIENPTADGQDNHES
jgi:hypothetical protein